jgi:hypothetical protein
METLLAGPRHVANRQITPDHSAIDPAETIFGVPSLTKYKVMEASR